MTSSPHAPYVLGYTHDTMVRIKGCQTARWSQSQKTNLNSDCRLQFCLHEAGIASKRRSARCVEYVPGPCTHRPSHHESWKYPKFYFCRPKVEPVIGVKS